MRQRLSQLSREALDQRLKTAKGSTGTHREIPPDFVYNSKKLKHIKHVLHNVNVALGTLVSAINEFSKAKGPDISPDGMLGGLGYVMPIRDIKEGMNSSIKTLSDISDSLADELSNPKWNAKNDADVKKLIKEKEKIEEQVEEVPNVEEEGDSDKVEEPGAEEIEEEDKSEEDSEESLEEGISPEDVTNKSSSDIKLSDLIEDYETKAASSKTAMDKAIKDNLIRFHLLKK